MVDKIMVNAWLCRAARVALDLSQAELAQLSETAVGTISKFEGGLSVPHDRTIGRIQAALEKCGVRFVSNDEGTGFLRVPHAGNYRR